MDLVEYDFTNNCEKMPLLVVLVLHLQHVTTGGNGQTF